MPEPIVIPITNPIELQKPSRRLSRSPCGADVLTVMTAISLCEEGVPPEPWRSRTCPAGALAKEDGYAECWCVHGLRLRTFEGNASRPMSHERRARRQTTGGHMAVAATNFEERVNVGRIERWLSMIAGGALAGYALKRREVPGGVAAIAGAALLYRGTTGHCDV